ncbi:polyprenyl synthetase family protein [Streptomyces sp. NPDC005775]|uniref:polyprenyl synthetase family protein n=1 Tax=Streptomyces sp. NPDC005775 TaxID=3364729 RepID=UPI00369F9310
MRGLRPTAAGPAEPDDALLTVSGATKAVESVLERVLDARTRQAREVDAVFAQDIAMRVAAFVLRGGKRVRTGFVWCGWRAAGGSGDPAAVMRTAAALELLQACALIHDDVMDGSPLRRGSPAIHVEFAQRHRPGKGNGFAKSFGTSAAVLAGDLALAWADDLLTETALGSPHGSSLFDEWRSMRGEMVAGQYRDIHAQASGSGGVEEALTIATLKSALYTVARPMALGASIAGADGRELTALRAAGRCAGLAFQLRDDLLGAFGDPAVTGKPSDDDLRSRKLTYLLAVALRLADAADDRDATAVLAPGAQTGADCGVERMRAALERTGARSAVEAKIAELSGAGRRHFAASGACPAVRQEFAALVEQVSGVGSQHAEEIG